jgi:hypothetical protein
MFEFVDELMESIDYDTKFYLRAATSVIYLRTQSNSLPNCKDLINSQTS